MGLTAVGAVDVQYDDRGGARAAAVVGNDLTMTTLVQEHVIDIARVEPYEPGALFKRELPCIQAVLALGGRLDLLIVDGYATLDPEGRPGLGAHAAAALGVPVIGVAKTPFRGATHAVEVIRGAATRPLYVTAAGGIEDGEAARVVAGMAGRHRIPSALARVDRLARGREQPFSRMFPAQPMAERYVGLEGITARHHADADARVGDLRYLDLDALGLEFVLHADYRRDRLNLVVRDGRVVEAVWG